MGEDPLPVTLQLCEVCQSEGRIYRQCHGGWDEPREIDCGPCPECEGNGEMLFEAEPATETEIMSAGSIFYCEDHGEFRGWEPNPDWCPTCNRVCEPRGKASTGYDPTTQPFDEPFKHASRETVEQVASALRDEFATQRLHDPDFIALALVAVATLERLAGEGA